MFDNMNIIKAFKIHDNINGNDVEVCTFNAMLNKDSGIHINMNINYPKLYSNNKDNILVAYRKFSSDVTALAVTMGLATTIETDPSILDNLEGIRTELTSLATDAFKQVIGSLGDIQVNPVPTMDYGYTPDMNNSYR